MRTTLPKPHSSKSGNNKSCGGSKFITLKDHQVINLKKNTTQKDDIKIKIIKMAKMERTDGTLTNHQIHSKI
jgi:hypothetical protein